MSDATPRLGLPWLMPAQAQKHVTVNESLGRLDALVQAAVQSRTEAAQPAAPSEGDAWVLPAGASGSAWAGFAQNDIAYFQDGAWRRIAARAGLTAWVADEAALVMFDGAEWSPFVDAITSLANLTGLGVGTAPDGYNTFAAKLNNALWTALSTGEGGSGDLRYTLNKQAAGNVLSVLFQSGWSGRAELGLTGEDDITLKVSPNGSDWTEALRVDRQTGGVQLGRASIGALTSLNSGQLAGLRRSNINGGFADWPRGDSFSGPALTQTAAMWRTSRPSMTVDRSSDAPSWEFDDSLEFASTGGAPAGVLSDVEAAVARIYALRPGVLSFWAKSVAGGGGLEVSLRSADGADAFSTVTARFTETTPGPISSAWTRYSYAFDPIPEAVNGLRVQIERNGADTAHTRIAGVQLESGEVATHFEHWPRSLEILARERFLKVFGGGSAYGAFAQVSSFSATIAYGALAFSQMRAAPTISFNGAFQLLGVGGTVSATLQGEQVSDRAMQVRANATGLTSGAGYVLRAANDPAARIILSAEL